MRFETRDSSVGVDSIFAFASAEAVSVSFSDRGRFLRVLGAGSVDCGAGVWLACILVAVDDEAFPMAKIRYFDVAFFNGSSLMPFQEHLSAGCALRYWEVTYYSAKRTENLVAGLPASQIYL